MGEITAVLYCRVSTARQAEEELPIASQRERCEDKARALGATVLRVYCDEGLSGQRDDRPAFQAAILYCETHAPTYLITWSTSRFARNRLDAQLYKRRLRRAGTALVYAAMDIDRETDGGFLTEGIMELFDEYIVRQIAADTRRSMIRAAKNGYWGGGSTPYGYRSIIAPDDPKRRRLAIVPEEADIVRRVFELRANGMVAKAIARRNSKLYEVLEEFGRNAPNLGDLSQRLQENNRQIKKLQEEVRRVNDNQKRAGIS